MGEQLLLITPRWGGSVRTTHADPTGLGILTDFILGGQLWTGLWSPQRRMALGPALQLCMLKEGQRTLLALTTWATAGVTQL